MFNYTSKDDLISDMALDFQSYYCLYTHKDLTKIESLYALQLDYPDYAGYFALIQVAKTICWGEYLLEETTIDLVDFVYGKNTQNMCDVEEAWLVYQDNIELDTNTTEAKQVFAIQVNKIDFTEQLLKEWLK